ncbi:MAG: hypothetical protein J5798_10550 [Spirochaetaceae bacterium]|nr:hypothetical protein [Spirochaetaceae bacterium]
MQIFVDFGKNSEKFCVSGTHKLILQDRLNLAYRCKFPLRVNLKDYVQGRAFGAYAQRREGGGVRVLQRLNLQFRFYLAKRPVCAYAQTGNWCTKTAFEF